MAFTISPSVIVREVDASQVVPAIATPPGAIAGVFRWGPVNEPILITSEDNLVSRFGKPNNDNYETFFVAADFLAYANPLYVVRADNGANTASTTDTSDANTSLHTFGVFEAKYPGSLGNSLKVTMVDNSAYSEEIFTVGSIPTNQIVGAVELGIPDGGNTSVTDAQVFPFNTSDELIFQAQPGTTYGVNTPLDSDAFTPGDVISIGNPDIGYQELEIASANVTPIDAAGDETTEGSENAYLVRLALAPGNRYTLSETIPNKLSITRKYQHSYLFKKSPSSSNGIHIVVEDEDGAITGEAGTILEVFEDLSRTPGATLPDGRVNYVLDVIENFSSWISVANTSMILDSNNPIVYESLTGGTDGDNETAVSLGALGPAYDKFRNANELDISFVLQGKGDNAGTRANYIMSNLVDFRKDCVLFISPSKEAVVDTNKNQEMLTNVITYRNRLQNSSYWFMDSGYKYRYDKYNDLYRWVPLNGDMAGLCARVEPFESPAGFRKGIIKNVVKLAFNPDKDQRDQLYTNDINPVMSQIGQGILLFGDKTGLGVNSAFDRINVRRLFIAVEKAIATASQQFLFELNDEFTQTQFKNIVEPFLREIQGRRGIIDFRVISDSTVNTPEIIDQNKFRANIFIKPARSINVIELTFVATRTGIEFDEIVGQLT